MQIKTAIVGLGGIGLNYDYNLKNFLYTHTKCLIKNKNFKLCFGVDSNYFQIKKFKKKYKIDCFNNLKEGFKKFFPEFVVISVPTKHHYDVFKKIVKYKSVRFILLEKPGGSNYFELKKMIDIAKKKKIKLFINYPRIYSNYYNKLIINLKKSLKFNIFVFYSRGISNNCSHYISFLNFFLKKIIKINILKIKKTCCK
jgi:predicted dehydrogenase